MGFPHALTYEQAERRLRGAEWRAYQHVWRTGAARFSNVAASAAEHPIDPEVLAVLDRWNETDDITCPCNTED